MTVRRSHLTSDQILKAVSVVKFSLTRLARRHHTYLSIPGEQDINEIPVPRRLQQGRTLSSQRNHPWIFPGSRVWASARAPMRTEAPTRILHRAALRQRPPSHLTCTDSGVARSGFITSYVTLRAKAPRRRKPSRKQRRKNRPLRIICLSKIGCMDWTRR